LNTSQLIYDWPLEIAKHLLRQQRKEFACIAQNPWRFVSDAAYQPDKPNLKNWV
jgi:hypothetical protein